MFRPWNRCRLRAAQDATKKSVRLLHATTLVCRFRCRDDEAFPAAEPWRCDEDCDACADQRDYPGNDECDLEPVDRGKVSPGNRVSGEQRRADLAADDAAYRAHD